MPTRVIAWEKDLPILKKATPQVANNFLHELLKPLGVEFPEDFQAFLEKYPKGAKPIPHCFEAVVNKQGKTKTVSVDEFLPFLMLEAGLKRSMCGTEYDPPLLPSKFIKFATANEDHSLYLSVNGDNRGTVYYLSVPYYKYVEVFEDETLIKKLQPVAAAFTEFLDSLKPDPKAKPSPWIDWIFDNDLESLRGWLDQKPKQRAKRILERNRQQLSPVSVALQAGNLEVLVLFIECGVTAKDMRVGYSRPDLYGQLLQRGVLTNSEVQSSLTIPGVHQQPELVKKLMVAGANVQAEGVLHAAAQSGNPASIRLILDAGVDINAKDKDGNTALHAAAKSGNLEGVRQMLNAGSDIHARNSKGNTALHLAAKVQPATDANSVMTFLLECGARHDIPNEEGHAPLHIAAGTNPETVERMKCLIKAGAELHRRFEYPGKLAELAVPRSQMSQSPHSPTAAEVLCNHVFQVYGRMIEGSKYLPDLEAYEAECRGNNLQDGGSSG